MYLAENQFYWATQHESVKIKSMCPLIPACLKSISIEMGHLNLYFCVFYMALINHEKLMIYLITKVT